MSKLPSVIRELSTVPPQLVIETRGDFPEMMRELSDRFLGFNGMIVPGIAFIQGNRLQFTCSLTMRQLLEISTAERAVKDDNVSSVLQKTNRPITPSHKKKIQEYLKSTACAGDKFILPNFIANFGAKLNDDTPDATLLLVDRGQEGARIFVAVLLLPHGAKLMVTDGSHREDAIRTIAAGKDAEATTLMLDNAVAVSIVFEGSERDSHQDFADCGKTKPISRSTLNVYDARDVLNRRATEFANDHPFFVEYCDGTSNTVNLSKGSHKVWSLAAARTMFKHIIDRGAPGDPTETEEARAERLLGKVPAFFDTLIEELPQLKVLEAHRNKHPRPHSETPKLREANGGDVGMRMIGLVIFARAYLYCLDTGMTFRDMAKRLAKINWNVIKRDAEEYKGIAGDAEAYMRWVMANADPIWRPVLVFRARRHKISSSTAEADRSWDLILSEIGLLKPALQAAE